MNRIDTDLQEKKQVTYTVTVKITDPSIVDEWQNWMEKTHIPDVIRTGCFINSSFTKIENNIFVISYGAKSLAEYERYQANFAPRLQRAHSDRYAGRFEATRKIE